MHDISETYASQMPDWLTQAFFDPDLQRQRINTHQYCESDNVWTMRKMDNLHLLDFVELWLKSIHDFEAAYDSTQYRLSCIHEKVWSSSAW